MDAVSSATLVEGKGLEDSANFGSHRQVTLISLERWLDMIAELGTDVDPSARRGDLLVSGIDLDNSRGRTLSIGSCLVRVAGEVRPCERMEEACRGLRAVMSPPWNGGAWAEIVRGGEIQVSDSVRWEPDLFSAIPAAG
jgi:MOSC domain-containing protein YiiM